MLYHKLAIPWLLSLFCTVIAAQDNPFMAMAEKVYAEYSYDLNECYNQMNVNDTVDIQLMIQQLKEVARKTGGREWALEVRYAELAWLNIKYRLEGYENAAAEELQITFDLLEKAKKENLPQLELRFRRLVIETCWSRINDYELAFQHCAIQDRRLMEISANDVPEKTDFFIQIANAHYRIKDEPRAIT
jgi:hypothetical protein